MSEKRYLRLLALALSAVGAGGTALAIFTDLFRAADGTATFPVAFIAGLAILIKLRPRTNRNGETK